MRFLWRSGLRSSARGIPAKSLRAAPDRQSGIGKQRANRRFLARPQFHDQPAARRQQTAGVMGNGAVTIKAVGAAVERKRRVVVAHLRRKRGDIAVRHVRRVGDDQIERTLQRPAAISQATKVQRDARTKTLGIGARDAPKPAR